MTDNALPHGKRLIIVLGMHRSGTSAITRGLQALNVDLGESLIEGLAQNNEKGFWEDAEINALNNELLERFGMCWHSLASVPDLTSQECVEAFRVRALKLLREKTHRSQIFGIKDPRMSRLLNFWQPLFEHEGYQTDYIIAARHPMSVADSLSKRDGFATEKSFYLWLEHQLPAVLNTVGQRRLVVAYDRVLEEPAYELERIAQALDLPIASKSSLTAYADDFLETELRHSVYKPHDLTLISKAPSILREAYLELLEASVATTIEPLDRLTEVFRDISTALEPLKPGFAFMDRQALEIKRLEEAQGQQADEINRLLPLLNACQRDNALLVKKEEEQRLLNASLEQSLLSAQSELQSLRSAQLELQSLRSAHTELQSSLLAHQTELQRVYDSNSWRLTTPLRACRQSMPSVSTSLIAQLSEGSRWLWHRLPVSNTWKLRIKQSLFQRFPALFSWSQAYRNWHGLNSADNTFSAPPSFASDVLNGCFVPLLKSQEPSEVPVRLIAFYLPQFHAIAQNNEWWGQGFTEWSNVKPATPQFEGHYQPHIPGELGYYNLLDRRVQQRQIELAKLYGVGGFCFYYYWFGGKRLLEQPIENYLADSSLDHPFCLCWANENWSRRWDGLDSQILIAQEHSPQDDLAIAADFARHMRDPRYIRISGKPLLLVYRPSLLPSARETSERWRDFFRAQGIGEVYLAYTQSFESEDPAKYGFDAAIEFPPNNSSPPDITKQVNPLTATFNGTVYDWTIFPKRAAHYKKPPYRLFRSVCPSWDNSARRKGNGTVFLNSTPQQYQQWLERAVKDTCERFSQEDERLVFVNAWNEWAEGAHLEPDQKYGYAWLEATRKALTGETFERNAEPILVVSHDAHPHGAQFLALGMVRSLARDLKFDVHCVLLGEGRLRTEFAVHSTVHDMQGNHNWHTRASQLAEKLARDGVRHALVNTTVSGPFAEILASHGIRCICLIHEMPGVIQNGNLASSAQQIAHAAEHVVFPAQIVAEGYKAFATVTPEKQSIRPQGLWRRNGYRHNHQRVRAQVRQSLGIAADAQLILAVGYADRRKGTDLFVRAALQVLHSHPGAIFVWIGHAEENMHKEVTQLIRGHETSFRFLGYQADTARYHAAADIFALTSREDPFPNVVLESFDAGVPVVAFAQTGGGAALVAQTGGEVVLAEDFMAFATSVKHLLDNPEKRLQLGREASELVDRDYAFRQYLFELCTLAGMHLPKISVVVPNFNYAHHITRRLDSILNQSVAIYELIILDDASTDDSVDVISEWLRRNAIECRLVINEQNSGNVSEQWAKGVALATGDFVWIAEADDLCSPMFLETLLAPMLLDEEITLSYCESIQIDEHDITLARNYKDYVNDISEDRWDAPYVAAGADELAQCLAIKNTIPNVSAVLFKHDALIKVFNEHLPLISSFRRAGDWVVYAKILQSGKIAFNSNPLNQHRRHSGSVIGGSSGQQLIDEITAIQALVARESSPDAIALERARNYATHLREQFSLPEA